MGRPRQRAGKRRALVLALGLGAGVVTVAGCGSSPSPTPVPATVDPSWNPDRDVLDQAAAVWDAQQPEAVAYTVALEDPAGAGTVRYRVSSLEGAAEVQYLDGDGDPALTADDLSIAALYDRAAQALDAGIEVEFEVDRTYGAPVSITVPAGSGSDGWSAVVSEFMPAGDPASGRRAQDALGKIVDRWSRRLPDEFEYRWVRYRAADGPSVPTVWRVRFTDGKVRSSSESEASGAVPSDTATPGGTVAMLQRDLAAGAWIDIAGDSATGRDILAAVDPSPAVDGDAYWIRIDFTDLVAAKARNAQAAAVARWSERAPAAYTYTWRYAGDGRELDYRVTVDGANVSVRPLKGSPAVEEAWVSPRIEDTLAMLGAVLEEDGLVKAIYDKRYGFPEKAVIVPHGAAGRNGTITITGFKTP